jgi:dTDP-4-amino-4,6-dideoxygalactose transaminase
MASESHTNDGTIRLAEPTVDRKTETSVLKVLRSGRFILGKETSKFEEEFARYCGTDFAVALSSGTASLHLALLGCGVSKGDEVITVSNSFIATANAIKYTGASPVFVDVDPETCTMNPTRIEAVITNRTKAIVPVHLYGHPADMDPILDIARKHGLYVIEDACQAHGALYKGKRVGSCGNVGCFSFYPSKNMMVCGDGGMAVTDNEEIAEVIRMLRNQGQRMRYVHEVVGYSYRMNEISAAIGRLQMVHLDEWNEDRRKNARLYLDMLGDLEGVGLPIEKKWGRHVYHLFVIRIKKRDRLLHWLSKRGIESCAHYATPIHLQPAYRTSSKGRNRKLDETEKCSREVLSLPCHQNLEKRDVERVATNVREFMNNL